MEATTTTITRADTEKSSVLSVIKALFSYDPGIPLGAIMVLGYLYQHRNAASPVSLRTLRAELELYPTLVSRSVYYWSEDVISISIDPKDKRGRLLHLTPKGVGIFERIEKASSE